MKAWLLLWIAILASTTGGLTTWLVGNPTHELIKHGQYLLFVSLISLFLANLIYLLTQLKKEQK